MSTRGWRTLTPCIRRIEPRDVPRVAELCGQLGYPSTEAQVAGRLSLLHGSELDAILVAEADGEVMGWAHVHLTHTLESEPTAELWGLVIDQEHRSIGIGAELLRAAEAWAVERGYTRMVVRSNVIRERAHEFYKRHGYEVVKSQYNLRKELRLPSA